MVGWLRCMEGVLVDFEIPVQRMKHIIGSGLQLKGGDGRHERHSMVFDKTSQSQWLRSKS
jgi:hypothetical protein